MYTFLIIFLIRDGHTMAQGNELLLQKFYFMVVLKDLRGSRSNAVDEKIHSATYLIFRSISGGFYIYILYNVSLLP